MSVSVCLVFVWRGKCFYDVGLRFWAPLDPLDAGSTAFPIHNVCNLLTLSV